MASCFPVVVTHSSIRHHQYHHTVTTQYTVHHHTTQYTVHHHTTQYTVLSETIPGIGFGLIAGTFQCA